MNSIRRRVFTRLFVVAIASSSALRGVASNDVNGSLGTQGASGAEAASLGEPCVGISYDKGQPVNAWGLNTESGSAGIFLQRFVPTNLPFRPTSVCVAGRADSTISAVYEIVVFGDLNGKPGTLIARIPAAPSPDTAGRVQWLTTVVDGSIAPQYGPFWAGVRQSGRDLDVCYDPTLRRDQQGPCLMSVDDGRSYTPVADPLSSLYTTALYIRVVGQSGADAVGIPALSVLGMAAFVAALAVGGSLLLRGL